MGALKVPDSGLVYLDANPIIYTVEKHPNFGPLLEPLWQAAQSKTIEIVTSELSILEVLAGPIKRGDSELERTYEQALSATDLRLLPITPTILAARLHANIKLKTPDALHAATAQEIAASCSSPTMLAFAE